MPAQPWPNRYTRIRHAGLKGFAVRPRLGPIDLNGAGTGLIVKHGGWTPPFEDEAGEPILGDGVNPGTPLGLSSEAISNVYPLGTDGSGPHYNVHGARGKREGHHRHGVIDWRGADGRHVLSWVATPNRYAAPGTLSGSAQTNSNALWYRGKMVGRIPTGGDLGDGIFRPVKGACVYRDAATATSWMVVVVFVLTDPLRQNNDYTEEVWMRRLGRKYQDQATTGAALDQLIQEAEAPGLSAEDLEQKLAELDAELDKWLRVAAIDADPLLPAPPTGDPKVSPLSADLAYWLFNASGDECQTIRMVMASQGGTFDPGSWQAQDQQRLKIGFDFSVSEEVVLGRTFYRPAASVGSAQAFATVSGTVSSSHVVTRSDTTESKEILAGGLSCSGNFEDVIMARDFSETFTEDENWSYTFAVDYAGDQEVFASYALTRDYDRAITVSADIDTSSRCGDPDWAPGPTTLANNPGSFEHNSTASFFSIVETETKQTTYDIDGLMIAAQTTRNETLDQNDTLDSLGGLVWEYDATTGPDGSPPTATLSIDQDSEALAIRHLDLRLGIVHYVASQETIDDDTDSNEVKSKEARELVDIDGLTQQLQFDSDNVSNDNTARATQRLNASVEETNDSSMEAATFLNSSLAGAGYYGIQAPSAGWDRDGDGNVLGSALLGELFAPYGAAGFGPHGHESVYNRYDGAGESVQDLFGIKAVNAGDVFVCYPLMFQGA